VATNVTSCHFSFNGIGPYGSSLQVNITDSLFQNNVVGVAGAYITVQDSNFDSDSTSLHLYTSMHSLLNVTIDRAKNVAVSVTDSAGVSGVNVKVTNSKLSSLSVSSATVNLRDSEFIGAGNTSIVCLKCSLTLLNVRVTLATSLEGNGGGLLISGPSSFYGQNVTLDGNSATDGGGFYCNGGGQATLQSCTITNNTAKIGGGFDCDPGNGCTVKLPDTVVKDNYSSTGKDGSC